MTSVLLAAQIVTLLTSIGSLVAVIRLLRRSDECLRNLQAMDSLMFSVLASVDPTKARVSRPWVPLNTDAVSAPAGKTQLTFTVSVGRDGLTVRPALDGAE